MTTCFKQFINKIAINQQLTNFFGLTGKHSRQDLDDIAGEDFFWHGMYASFQILSIDICFGIKGNEMALLFDYYRLIEPSSDL